MTTNKERESLTIAAAKAQATAPVVLITGALTRIGRATALAFARQGARIVVSGRNEDTGKTLVADLNELQAESTFIKSEVKLLTSPELHWPLMAGSWLVNRNYRL